MTERLVLASLSGAMDGGLTAIAEVADVLGEAGALDQCRLIGGVTVLLHQMRLEINLPLRVTGDADFGLPRLLLKDAAIVDAIEARGYQKVLGNRWERPLDATRTAAVDLLVPAYRSRARDTVKVGDIVTTEVPGLAEALRRPGIKVDVQVVLTDGSSLTTTVVIPDAASTLGLKAWARTVRNEERDAQDLWRCLEIALADGVTVATFTADPSLGEIIPILQRELGPEGSSVADITRAVPPDEAARRRTRLRALVAAVAGVGA
jgi:hypothetical protein